MMKRNILLIPFVAGSVVVAASQTLAADLEPATAAPTPTPVLAAPTAAADPTASAVLPETPLPPTSLAAPAPPAPMPRVEHVVVPKAPKAPKPFTPPPPPHAAKVSPDMVEEMDVDEDLGAGVLDEERDLDVRKAIKRYQAEMEKFDRQCQQATDAMFRLFESCNKLGQPNVAMAQLDRLQKKLETQQALVATLQKKMAKIDVVVPGTPPKRIAHAPIRVKVNPVVEMKLDEPVEDVFIPNEPGHAADAMEPMVEDGEDNDIPAVKRTRDLADVTTLNNARELARINGKLNADQQAAVRSMQQEMKKLQAEMSALKEMKSSLRISDEAREKLEDARAELELAKVNLRNAQKEREDTVRKLNAINTGSPTHLPPPADSDPQYARLRDEIVNLELNMPSGDDTNAIAMRNGRINNAMNRLKKYVEEVYVPSVQVAAKFAEEQCNKAANRVEERRLRFQAIQREIEKSAAKEGKPPKEKKPAKEAPTHDESGEDLQKN